MSNSPPPPIRKRRDRRCVFRCTDSIRVYRFPQDPAAVKFWMDTLGLKKLPRCPSESFVCNNHFTPSQLSVNGKKLTTTAIPDRNIPSRAEVGKLVREGIIPCDEPSIIVPSESEFHIIKPPVGGPLMNLAAIPRIVEKPTIVTSAASKCYLKCKDYNSLARFPPDVISYNIWLKKLDLPETTATAVSKYRRIALCDNHFSPAMKAKTGISRWAIPDQNLPSQCTFIDELSFQANNSEAEKEVIIPDCDSQPDPIIIDESPTPEILINPINFQANMEGIIHVFQPNNVNNNTITTIEEDEIICAEIYKKGKLECVLKCPDFKKLYPFPQLESRRQHWLTQVGLTHCFFKSRICDRHFSEKMLSNKRLTPIAFPDINLPEKVMPRIRVASLPLQHPPLFELPQYISVLTVFKRQTEIEAVVNGTKYIEIKVGKQFPKREREIQVDMSKDFRKVDAAISADEESDVEYLEPHLLNTQDFELQSKNMFECLKCGEILSDYDSNLKHLDSHEKMRCLCSHCGLVFVSQQKLRKHEMKVHQPKQVLRCPKEHCQKAFYSKKLFYMHLEEHLKRTRYTCKNCWRLFFSSLKLHSHELACRPRSAKKSRTKI